MLGRVFSSTWQKDGGNRTLAKKSPAKIRKALATKVTNAKQPGDEGYVKPTETSKLMRKAGTHASGGGQDRDRKIKSPATINNAAYEKSNRKMRSKYTKETGKTFGKRHLKGTSPRRVSFACRFAGKNLTERQLEKSQL